MKSYIDDLLDLIYPRRCPLCGEALPYKGKTVCRECLKKLKRIQEPKCFRCGKTIEDEETEYCKDCQNVKKSYIRGYPVFEYSGNIKNAIYDFKYKNQRNYADFFADCIFHAYKKEFEKQKFDGIIPVPVHRKKKKQRGYNQAELIAKELGERLHIPVYEKALVRVVNTNPQKELNDKARMKNLKNAFKLGLNTIELKKVLLVDDIYTTGATIEACTQVLTDAGVLEVYYTSVAIGHGF